MAHHAPLLGEIGQAQVRAKLAKAMPANRNLGFIMQLWAVGIGIQ